MNKKNIENFRTDIVTKEKKSRDELIRICIFKDGSTHIDYNYNMGGRGIYISKSSINLGLEKGILKKAILRFKGDINLILKELEIIKKGE